MNELPLVSIICTTFNQANFVLKTLDSLLDQDYQRLEIKIVDNGSTDDTPHLVSQWVQTNGRGLNVEMILREQTVPYCSSFNDVFAKCKGKYLIDLSGDDILLPEHVTKSVEALTQNPGAALCFSDVLLCAADGIQRTFYDRDSKGRLVHQVPEGDVYELVVARLAMLSVSFVFNAEIFRNLGGYDEQLAYEDFDITIRMAREYRFVFSDHIGIAKTIHDNSWSQQQYRPKNSTMLPSTLLVCEKIARLNRRDSENQALFRRIMFECKHANWSANFAVSRGFLDLAQRLGYRKHPLVRIYQIWARNEWDLSKMYPFLHKITQR